MSLSGVRKIKVEQAEGQRLDNFLFRELKGVPKRRVYQMVRRGEVRVNGRRAKAETRLAIGDELRLPPAFTTEPSSPRASKDFLETLRGSILHSSEHLLCVNKPFGMAVHGGSGVRSGVIEGLRMLFPERRFLELAHRLDRDTSGVLLVACNRRTLLALHQAFRDGEVEKVYDLLVYGRWPEGERLVQLPLSRRSKEGVRRLVVVDDAGKRAETQFERVTAGNACSWLRAAPKTGRTHQIRVHASAYGHAVVGDERYATREQLAGSSALRPRRLWLHARKLAFRLGEESMCFESNSDPEFAAALDGLGHPTKAPEHPQRAGIP